MASPYTLGLAAAAGLGASVVIAFGGFGLPETVAVPIGAFVMTMLASGILFLFASARRFNSAMLVLVGIQTEQYLDLSDQAAQSKQLVLFVKGVAQDQKISTDEVLVNSTSLKDGIIVRFKDENYRVHLNEDNNSYTLERTHIIDHNVYVDGKH